jgi:peptidoglycan/xylan/chitin deacetylase (PgdA/CDA1 family)
MLVARRRVSIVLYHDPEPAVIARHLEFLAGRYTPITLGELAAALRTGDLRSLPPFPVVITIDDGHRGNRALSGAFERHAVRPTIFLCSQIAATSRHFWFLDADPRRVEQLKGLENGDRLAELERDPGFTPDREFGEEARQALSRAEIVEMEGACDFESHGRFHPVLTRCAADVAEDEIAASRDEVAALTDRPCRHFAYPLGAYTSREARLAEKAGYESARTVDIGWNGPSTDPYRLKILSVADDLSDTMLAAELTGLKWLLRVLRREGRFDGTFRPHWDPGVGR